MSTNTIIYLCNFVCSSIKKERDISTDSQAASNKIKGICHALQSVGVDVGVLSMGRGRQRGSWSKYSSVKRNVSGLSVVYAAFLDAPVITHFVTAISLMFSFISLAKKNRVTLIVYNRFWHYVPTLLVARFLKVPCYLDLEDGYIGEPGSFLRLLVRFFDWSCSAGALLACDALSAQVKSKKTMVCYGVADLSASHDQNWQSGKLNVLWGGGLAEETGGKLFMRTIQLLSEKYPDLQDELHFQITGRGEMAEIVKHFALKEVPEWVTFHGTMPVEEFKYLRSQCHIGLSLNLPSSGLNRTVFPSKTIELTACGLLLVSTQCSDVAKVFAADNALLLKGEEPNELVDTLCWAAKHRFDASLMASKGRETTVKRCSLISVGEQISGFTGVR